jgi:virulence factor Mce-like protein
VSSGRRTASNIVANPVLVGSVTMLVIVVAVFLAYNANSGLPFVPTYEVKVETPNAARLVQGNDVREGGFRIGQVSKLENVRMDDGRVGAMLTLTLDKAAGPLPRDSQMVVRPRSTLGLKYVEVVRGRARQTLPQGATLTGFEDTTPPELDEVFDIFTDRTRRDIQTNLGTFGSAFAGRGGDLNRTFVALPDLLRDVQPVMRTLSDPDTRLARFFDELQDTARITRPVADELAHLFTAGADVFEAFSRDPAALDQTIARSPGTLRVGTPALRAQRPFLRRFAGLSDEIVGTARELRRSVRPVSAALRAGTQSLPQTVRLSEDLGRTFTALRDLSVSPTTNLVLGGLQSTATTLTHTLRWLGPHVTVCNYWNSWWTFLADHIAEEVDTGTVQRIQVKFSDPLQPNSPASFGASRPANGGHPPPAIPGVPSPGDPVNLHAQPYGRAVNERGEADCETGQRGYPERAAKNLPSDLKIAVDPRTPGDQGPTYTGRRRVPDGQTFTAEPGGLAPEVATP